MFNNFNLSGGLTLGPSPLGLLLLLVMSGAYAKDDVAYLAMSDGYWQVWMMDADGKNSHALTHTPYDKSRISWYPNNDALLVSGNQGELVKLALNGQESPVQIQEKNVNDAVLSPDGHYMAYSYKPEGNIFNKLVLKNMEIGEVTKIAWMQGFQHEPMFSHDSKTLYFLSGESGQTHDIWLYNMVTRNQEAITVGSLYNLDVAPSAQGKLAFSSNRSGNYEIWVKDGNSLRMLTNDPVLDGRPNWAGEKDVYFESSNQGVMNIWMVTDSKNAKAKQITFSKEGARYPLFRAASKVTK